MEQSTCQSQRIGLKVFLQELDDVPIVHPRRHHGKFLAIHRDSDEFQYVRMRQMLPGYDLSVEVLQVVRFDWCEEAGQGALLF